MRKQKHSYEREYFKKRYSDISDFSQDKEKKTYNWFKGIFYATNSYTNALDGNNKTAIEFGCATGSAAKVLSDFGYTVTATDISTYAVNKAKKLYPEIRFFIHDIQKAHLAKKRYDLVIALDVIEHLENPDKAIKNMFNLVRSDGLVLCSTPNDYPHERKVPTHISVKKPNEWVRIFKDAGFKKIVTHQMIFLPFFYRFHWRLNIGIPFPISIPNFCCPVFIFAQK